MLQIKKNGFQSYNSLILTDTGANWTEVRPAFQSYNSLILTLPNWLTARYILYFNPIIVLF